MEGLTFYQAFHGLTIMGVMQLIPWLMIFIVDIYGVFYYIYIYISLKRMIFLSHFLNSSKETLCPRFKNYKSFEECKKILKCVNI